MKRRGRGKFQGFRWWQKGAKGLFASGGGWWTLDLLVEGRSTWYNKILAFLVAMMLESWFRDEFQCVSDEEKLRFSTANCWQYVNIQLKIQKVIYSLHKWRKLSISYLCVVVVVLVVGLTWKTFKQYLNTIRVKRNTVETISGSVLTKTWSVNDDWRNCNVFLIPLSVLTWFVRSPAQCLLSQLSKIWRQIDPADR